MGPFCGVILLSIQLGVASVLTLHQLGGAWVAGPRDTPREAKGVAGRFVPAHRNLLEIFPQFVAALFLVHIAGAANALAEIGAWVFVVARVLYVPAYAFAPPGIGPLCWLASQAGVYVIVADLWW